MDSRSGLSLRPAAEKTHTQQEKTQLHPDRGNIALTETTDGSQTLLLVIDQLNYWQIPASHQRTGQSGNFLCWCVCRAECVFVPKVSLLSLCFLILHNSVDSVC